MPRRGEVWRVDFAAGRGSEQGGVRPALVIQNDVGNEYAATTIVAAITSRIKPYPVTVVVGAGKAGLKRRSMINLAQILTIDKSRLQRRMGLLDEQSMEEVSAAIRTSLAV
ncbi:MAG: type II toxin-antitoxin system PemK/MazF family toxin [Planctomycetes bacterium]|nr:type II toxin-antitoxin system PemK/MazF family toxin [Planctomycetota bacterium]